MQPEHIHRTFSSCTRYSAFTDSTGITTKGKKNELPQYYQNFGGFLPLCHVYLLIHPVFWRELQTPSPSPLLLLRRSLCQLIKIESLVSTRLSQLILQLYLASSERIAIMLDVVDTIALAEFLNVCVTSPCPWAVLHYP